MVRGQPTPLLEVSLDRGGGAKGGQPDSEFMSIWESLQIVLSTDDLLNMRETSKFHAECEWFGLGRTVVLPLLHVLRRPSGDDT